MERDAARLDPATVTSTDLLDGLREPSNRATWDAYVGRYRPMIVEYARRVGAAAEDAEEIAQQALAAFAEAYRRGSYRRDRGRLRDWLFGIVRRQLRNWYRRHRGREVLVGTGVGGTDFFSRVAGEDRLRDLWEAECRAAVLDHCLRCVRREVQAATWDAFELFACRNWPAARVAEQLGISENAVFKAKERVIGRIRELRPIAEEQW